MKTKEEAKKIGAVMMKKLGKKWKLRIHENMGWWVSATRGPLYVSADKRFDEPITYSCLMSADAQKAGDGLALWTPHNSKIYTDPVEAVRDQVKHAKKVIWEMNAAVYSAEEALKDLEPIVKCPYCGIDSNKPGCCQDDEELWK